VHKKKSPDFHIFLEVGQPVFKLCFYILSSSVVKHVACILKVGGSYVVWF
jgi:hypothetical protein